MPMVSSVDEPYVSALSVIHGRRQIGTNARRPRAADGSTGGSGHATSTASASPVRNGATSATDRTLVTGSRTPAAPRAPASARRFSSSFTTTRSGSSATMAATSGSLVPPTVGKPGCSQNRVTATGRTPQASSVSVTEGTRLTTRTGRRRGQWAAGRSAVRVGDAEESTLLDVELLAGERAALQHALELLELRRGVKGGGGAGTGKEAVLVLVDLGVDEVLHAIRMSDVGEALLAVLARRLDQEVTGADNALEHALV